MKIVNLLILFFVFSEILIAKELEIEKGISDESFEKLKAILSEIPSKDLKPVGWYTDSCEIEDQADIYRVSDAKVTARRNFLDGVHKVYGISIGIRTYYPNFPESLKVGKYKFKGILLYGTIDCGKDLSREQVKEFASIYNKETYKLFKERGQSPTK